MDIVHTVSYDTLAIKEDVVSKCNHVPILPMSVVLSIDSHRYFDDGKGHLLHLPDGAIIGHINYETGGIDGLTNVSANYRQYVLVHSIQLPDYEEDEG